MSPQAKQLRDVLKEMGITPIGGITTLKRKLRDPVMGNTYTEYGRAGTIVKGLTREQVGKLQNAIAYIYRASVKLPEYDPDQFWILEN